MGGRGVRGGLQEIGKRFIFNVRSVLFRFFKHFPLIFFVCLKMTVLICVSQNDGTDLCVPKWRYLFLCLKMTVLIFVSQNDGLICVSHNEVSDLCVSRRDWSFCLNSDGTDLCVSNTKTMSRPPTPHQRSFPQLLSHRHFMQLTLTAVHTVYGPEIIL